MDRSFSVPSPAAPADQQGKTFEQLVQVMRRLLAPGGCPWDREQNYKSLRRYVLEEACEVIDAIDSGDLEHLKEELGDLALQVVFLAELARAEGRFGPDDVMCAIIEKLVRRHPHVFGEEKAETSEEVLRNWETIKAGEKQDRALLAGVPRSLPALYRAQRMGDKVRRVGFDWPDGRGARDKVDEELTELDQALAEGNQDHIEQELGDVLFALVNLARHHGVDAELALRKTADRFGDRFAHVERRVKEVHGAWPSADAAKLPLQELDAYWEEAKHGSDGR